MSLRNALGDLVITDPQVMRALAHPARLAALSHLQRHGPATATQLSLVVGASPSVTSWHLRHLASFGLVGDADQVDAARDRRQRWWQATARGWALDTADNPEAQAAGRLLANELFATTLAYAVQWRNRTEPDLDPAWRHVAGPSDTRVRLTPAELAKLQEDVNALLAAYVHRAPAQAPADARHVRVIRYYLPDALP
jgi:DNA-binding transcriptional ArsR family regulator